MKFFNWSIILVFVIQVLLSFTFIFPLYCLSVTSYLFSLLNYPEHVKYLIISLGYLFIYILSFSILYLNKERDLFLSYLAFSLVHYFVISQVLYIIFANDNNDGQTFFLIYKYCLVSSFLSVPIGFIWYKFPHKNL